MSMVPRRVSISDYPHLPGGQCLSAILRGVFEHEGTRLSADMVVGLGGQLYFGYGCDLQSKTYEVTTTSPINLNHLMANTGARLEVRQTEDPLAAHRRLIALLDAGRVVPVIVHPAHCPSLRLSIPEAWLGYSAYHWIVVFGYDEARGEVTYYDPTKFKPFTLSYADLQVARAARTGDEMYDPDHRWLEYAFPEEMIPLPAAVRMALRQTALYYNQVPLHHPRLYVGLRGLSTFARQAKSWRNVLTDNELVANATRAFISINVANSVKGGFRYQYARFLEEAAEVVGDVGLKTLAPRFVDAGRKWQELHDALRQVAAEPTDMRMWERGSALFAALDGVYAAEEAAFRGLEAQVVAQPAAALAS